MVRIEGGVWRGRRLEVPTNKNLRPSSSKTKLSIFNILEAQLLKEGREKDLTGSVCLDLYAGVGSLGFEAMSRGADSVVFVEKDRLQLQSMRANVQSLSCESRTSIIAKPVEKCWDALSPLAPFHLVFLDPPYHDHSFLADLPRLVELLAPGAYLIMEHDPKLSVGAVAGLNCLSTRILGPAGISVYRKLS